MVDKTDTDNNEPILVTVAEANKVASTGPMGKLLNPAAEVLGSAFGQWAEKTINKRNKNLCNHIERVKNKNAELSVDANPRIEMELEEWRTEASNYADDEKIAELWQGIFDEILTSGVSQRRLMSIASELSSPDLDTLESANSNDSVKQKNPSVLFLADRGLITLQRKLTKKGSIYYAFLMAILSVLFLTWFEPYNISLWYQISVFELSNKIAPYSVFLSFSFFMVLAMVIFFLSFNIYLLRNRIFNAISSTKLTEFELSLTSNGEYIYKVWKKYKK